MEGFFNISEIEERIQIKSSPKSCLACGLYKTSKHDRMGVTGLGRKNILLIGSHNTFADDRVGERFKDAEGVYLRDVISSLGYNFDRDFWHLNALNCVPVQNDNIREPRDVELYTCQARVESVIEEIKPSHIITFGEFVNKQMWNGIYAKRGHLRWRGLKIPDRKRNAYIYPNLNLFDVMDERRPEFRATFERDLASTIEFIDSNPKTPKERFPVSEDKYVECLHGFQEIKKNLENLQKNHKAISFDYETTGLKPYIDGHKIATIAYATSHTEAYAFPFQWPNVFSPKELGIIKQLWCEVLESDDIALTAQNMKFEDMWSRVILDSLPNHWYFDPMVGTHILDTRTSFTGLKFQTYVEFGREPYDTGISKFLKGKPEFNTIFKAPLNDILIYNGLDCIYTEMLKDVKEVELINSEPSSLNPKYNEEDAYNMYHQGSLACSDIQINGIPCDDEYYLRTKEELTVQIDELSEYLQKGEEATQFKDLYGKEINLKSSQQLCNLFYDVLGYEVQYNKDGNRTADKNALKDIKLPFVEKLLEYKKLLKVRDTYIKGYIKSTSGGVIHPFINVHTTKSHRSSISMPSMQNVPNRDKVAKALCRGGLIPSRKDWHIGEADYSGIEVAMGCPYHQDPNMIKYVTDPSTNMHTDTGCDLFMLNPNQITKDIRQTAKNSFVFPEFYGDYWKQCALGLWEYRDLPLQDGTELKVHLAKKGIYSLEDFEEHVRKMEKIFWEKRFRVYAQWRKDQFERYLRDGYIDTFTGFRHRGVLNRKDVANHNIQGEAFRIQFYTLMNLNEELKTQKFSTQIINQIHDSIVFNMHPAEVDDVFHLMHDIGVTEVSEHYNWINVPLVIDFELAPAGESWNNKDDYNLVF